MTTVPTLTVNGKARDLPEAWIGRRLIDYLRTGLGLVGTREGCGEGDCGACTVLIEGEPMCSCLLLCGVVLDRAIVTVEGLGEDHRSRFADACETLGGVQCGFCTSGFAVMTSWISDGGGKAESLPTAKLLEGNICRCGAYLQLADVAAEFT